MAPVLHGHREAIAPLSLLPARHSCSRPGAARRVASSFWAWLPGTARLGLRWCGLVSGQQAGGGAGAPWARPCSPGRVGHQEGSRLRPPQPPGTVCSGEGALGNGLPPPRRVKLGAGLWGPQLYSQGPGAGRGRRGGLDAASGACRLQPALGVTGRPAVRGPRAWAGRPTPAQLPSPAHRGLGTGGTRGPCPAPPPGRPGGSRLTAGHQRRQRVDGRLGRPARAGR